VVLLLAIIIGLFAVMVQGASLARQKLEDLQASVRTVIELREAGAFGTGGFGGDRPAGADTFSLATLEQVQRVASAGHIIRIEEYIHSPQIDAARPNAYAMIIGLRPTAPMRAIGEVDYENARIIAGRALSEPDADRDVAVVGHLYAKERLGIDARSETALSGRSVALNGHTLEVIGIYATGNDFGDNHVFVPLEAFRRIYDPGGKLSKIRVTVDSVANVEAVTEDLKQLRGVDAVTASEQVSTARTTLGGMAAATLYASLLLFAIGGVLVAFVMVLATKERIREIGTLKAIGASNWEIAKQFLSEVLALTFLAALVAVLVAALFGFALRAALDLELRLDQNTLLLIVLGGFAFAAIGSCYPVFKGILLSPVQAMKDT
jgi:ABC-type antimicrobial peptide transport system permease subunit